MITKPDRPSRSGPLIRTLGVPEGDVPLRPARLRPGRRFPRLPRGLYGTALAAWTLGLLAATFGLMHGPGGHEREGTAASSDRSPTEPAVPAPAPAPPVPAESFKAPGRPSPRPRP